MIPFPESGELGLIPTLVRASIERVKNHIYNTLEYSLIIHPASAEIVGKVCDRITFSPRCIDLVFPYEFTSGAGFRVAVRDKSGELNLQVPDYVKMQLPFGYSIEDNFCLLSSEEMPLNEFGIYYVSAYVAGMFARYYPEYWGKARDRRTQTFRVIDSLMTAALFRAPLLLLSEFRDVSYVLNA